MVWSVKGAESVKTALYQIHRSVFVAKKKKRKKKEKGTAENPTAIQLLLLHNRSDSATQIKAI